MCSPVIYRWLLIVTKLQSKYSVLRLCDSLAPGRVPKQNGTYSVASSLNRLISRICLVSVSTGLLAACGDSGDSSLPPVASVTLQVLHLSDADGSDTTALGSVANLSGLVSRFRAELPNNTLVVS